MSRRAAGSIHPKQLPIGGVPRNALAIRMNRPTFDYENSGMVYGFRALIEQNTNVVKEIANLLGKSAMEIAERLFLANHKLSLDWQNIIFVLNGIPVEERVAEPKRQLGFTQLLDTHGNQSLLGYEFAGTEGVQDMTDDSVGLSFRLHVSVPLSHTSPTWV